MKRIILSLLLAVMVSPSATALTKEEAAASGDRSGDLTCQVIWDGARNQHEMVMMQLDRISRRDMEIVSFINRLQQKKGRSHPLVKAYRDASHKALQNCKDEFLRLTE